MVAAFVNLWSLALDTMHVDAELLASAVERKAKQPHLDFRTRLLIRDSLEALAAHWGNERLDQWIAASPAGDRLQGIRGAELGPAGFPSLSRRVMDMTRPDTVRQFIRELGAEIDSPARISIGGPIALILSGDLTRRTEDIHVVDEVPAAIRHRHDLLAALAARYNLRLTHFQSHFLPSGWADRLHSLGTFGRLSVFLVDPYDMFLSKLFSAREKDRDDLRVLATRLDRAALTRRLLDAAGRHLADQTLRQNATRNWYILFGQPLPYTPPPEPIK